MAENCAPLTGWNNHWVHCRGFEDACVEVELRDVMNEQVYVIINRTWAEEEEGEFIYKGEYIEYTEGSTVWRVYCDDIIVSQNLANIRICYEETEPAEGMKVGDTKTLGIMAFTLSSIVCTPVQKITAWSEGRSETIKLGAWALFPGPFIMGGLYVLFESVNAACDTIIDKAAEGGLTPEDVDDIDTLLEADYTRPDGTKPTPEEIHKVKMGVIGRFDYTDPEFVAMLKKLLEGTITKAEFEDWLKQYTTEKTKAALDNEYYLHNFILSIPGYAMAGDIKVSGIGPVGATVYIMGEQSFFGFDILAKDTELGSATVGADGKYTTTITLDEFGSATIYAVIKKGSTWLEWIVSDDIKSNKHSVFVLTWLLLIAASLAAAMIYDKSSGGKLQKLIKRGK